MPLEFPSLFWHPLIPRFEALLPTFLSSTMSSKVPDEVSHGAQDAAEPALDSAAAVEEKFKAALEDIYELRQDAACELSARIRAVMDREINQWIAEYEEKDRSLVTRHRQVCEEIATTRPDLAGARWAKPCLETPRDFTATHEPYAFRYFAMNRDRLDPDFYRREAKEAREAQRLREEEEARQKEQAGIASSSTTIALRSNSSTQNLASPSTSLRRDISPMDFGPLVGFGQKKRDLRPRCLECRRRGRGCDRGRPCTRCVQRGDGPLCKYPDAKVPSALSESVTAPMIPDDAVAGPSTNAPVGASEDILMDTADDVATLDITMYDVATPDITMDDDLAFLGSEPPRKKRDNRVRCTECRKTKGTCDRGTPCSRCVEFGIEDTCKYIARKVPKRRY